MATPIDVGILGHLAPIFTFTFIFVILYALLAKTKLLGEDSRVNSLAAFVIALLFLLTGPARVIIDFITPWFVVFFIMILFLVMLFMFVGVSEESIANAFKDPSVYYVIIIIFLIIFGIAISKVFGEQIRDLTLRDGEEAPDVGKPGLGQAVGEIIFDPKILGMFFILLVASFTVRYIASQPK